jgi:DNA-directed RNA polymerase subunit RPC12/RpoP
LVQKSVYPMSAVDDLYIHRLSVRLEKFKKVKAYLYNFRCPYCGDSQKHKNKARGYFFQVKGRMVYKCHNCGIGRTTANFLKDNAPDLYSEYQLEKYRRNATGKGTTVEKFVVPDSTPKFAKKVSDITSISELNNTHPAKQYLLDRKIPEGQLSRIYYVDKFKGWVNKQKETFANLQNDRPRIILPLIRTDGTWFGIQGRSLAANTTLRYITIMFDETEDKIFGLDKVNFDQIIYVTEGPLDSMFLGNSIAMCGADVKLSNYNCEFVYVYDNEPRNKQIIDRMEKTIADGHKIVIWEKNVKQKDLNDMVLAGRDVQRMVESNTYSGLEAKLKLVDWKKV